MRKSYRLDYYNWALTFKVDIISQMNVMIIYLPSTNSTTRLFHSITRLEHFQVDFTMKLRFQLALINFPHLVYVVRSRYPSLFRPAICPPQVMLKIGLQKPADERLNKFHVTCTIRTSGTCIKYLQIYHIICHHWDAQHYNLDSRHMTDDKTSILIFLSALCEHNVWPKCEGGTFSILTFDDTSSFIPILWSPWIFYSAETPSIREKYIHFHRFVGIYQDLLGPGMLCTLFASERHFIFYVNRLRMLCSLVSCSTPAQSLLSYQFFFSPYPFSCSFSLLQRRR